jgi:hypothetical protein
LIRGQVVSDDAGDFLKFQLLRGEIARVSRDDYVFPVDDDGNLETELGNARGHLVNCRLVVARVILVWLQKPDFDFPNFHKIESYAKDLNRI